MKISTFFLLLSCLSFPFIPSLSKAEEISKQEALDIGISAYLYFYPIITMDVTRKQMTNVEPGKISGFGPMNTFANMREYPTANMKAIVRPNFDTLYSSSWLDITQGPVIVSVPDTNGRYYLLPMLDMWTDVFASPGWRTTGTKAANFAIVPQGWKGKLPADTQQIVSPTPYVWIIGRVKTDGPTDYKAVHKIQDGFKVTQLADWNKSSNQIQPPINSSIDMKTPPKEQVEAMAASEYFAYAAELLKIHSPHLTDEPILALLKRIGFEQGKSFDMNNLSPTIKQSLNEARTSALKLMDWKLPTLARKENGWLMNTDTMGVYGNYYLKRAIIAREGLGANLPEDAIYPLNLSDNTGAPLNGINTYTIHFEKENAPPVEAFWSITLYDEEGYQVENSLERFNVSNWMPFTYNKDGSLDLYFSNSSPGINEEANWLPAPKGPFNLTMRLYAPKNAALVGTWNPPPIKKLLVSEKSK